MIIVDILLLSYLLSIIIFYLVETKVIIFYLVETRIIIINRVLGGTFFGLCLYFYGKGAITDESNVLAFLLAGLAVGHILFGISLLLTKLSLKEALKYCLPLKDIGKYYYSHPMVVSAYLLNSLYEEFIWRLIIQDRGSFYLGNDHLSIVLTALFFTLLHKKNLQGDSLRKLEFFLFSLFLGYAFFMFHSLTFVTVVHTIRNINICYRSEKEDEEEHGSCS